MLIDGGNKADGQLVVSYLLNAGVEELHTVISTHPHEDHVGGLASVMAVFPVGQVFSPTRSYGTQAFDNFAKYVDQQRLEMKKPVPGHKFNLGSATVTILGPVDSYSDVNNTSIVLMVQYGSNRFLFAGDQETDAETDLLNSGADVKADVLKVGHHGSSTSTGYRFLREVAPKYAIISCGTGNSYGHPHDAPLSRLRDAEVSVYRTDKMGHIIAVSDGTNITFSWQKTSAQPT
jgi:competence protein ComEC